LGSSKIVDDLKDIPMLLVPYQDKQKVMVPREITKVDKVQQVNSSTGEIFYEEREYQDTEFYETNADITRYTEAEEFKVRVFDLTEMKIMLLSKQQLSELKED
jgi:hypothetical protein